MATYKCRNCGHEIISDERPSNCECCGEKVFFIEYVAYERLEKFILEQSSKSRNKRFNSFLQASDEISRLEVENEKFKTKTVEQVEEISRLNSLIKVSDDEKSKKSQEIDSLQAKFNTLITEKSKYIKEYNVLYLEVKDLKNKKIKQSNIVTRNMIFIFAIGFLFGYVLSYKITENNRLKERNNWINIPGGKGNWDRASDFSFLVGNDNTQPNITSQQSVQTT